MNLIFEKHFSKRFSNKQEFRDHQKQLLRRLKQLNKTQIYLSSVFNRKPQQINKALKTDQQPTLLLKIEKHIEILESKSSLKSDSTN